MNVALRFSASVLELPHMSHFSVLVWSLLSRAFTNCALSVEVNKVF